MRQQTAPIVAFPFQRRTAHESKTCGAGVYPLKPKAAHMLNDVAAGTHLMSPDIIEGIQEVSRMGLQVGLPSLDYGILIRTAGSPVRAFLQANKR